MSGPYTIPRFGGLQLSDDPQEVGFGGAIDLLNVDLDRSGRLRIRPGFTQLTASEGTNRYDSLLFFQNTAGSKFLVAGAGTRVEVINSSGTVVATMALATASPHYFARLGTPAAEYVYFSNGTDRIRRTDGAAITSPAGLIAQTGKYVAAWQSRLVHARTATNPSRVAFSNAGDPETFTYAAGPPETGDFVDITPGDGEPITGLAVWGPYLFAFKQTKFAVFNGVGQDGQGGAIFDYRMVEVGMGVRTTGTACTGREGVYFIAADGVYVTVGDSPRLVSQAIGPLFRKDFPATYGGGTSFSPTRLAYAEGRLYMAVGDDDFGTMNKLFVFDPARDQWMVWSIEAAALTTSTWFSREQVTFAYSAGLKHIGRVGGDEGSATDDVGTAISWRYQLGFNDFGTSNSKRVGPFDLWGSGTLTVSVLTDHGTTDSNAGTVTLGTSPAVARGQHSKTYRGRLLSLKLSGTGPTTVHRADMTLRDQRVT